MNVVSFRSVAAPNKTVLLVGRGLVGEAICHQLGLFCIHQPHQSWVNSDWLDAKSLIDRTKSLVANEGIREIEIIWAAGHGGFSATKEQMKRETRFFESYMFACSKLKGVGLKVNLISSAGGIYENSGRVESLSEISPSRPYAHAKLRQEKVFSELGISNRIYRISSVFGLGGVRTGLVTTMLTNANFGKPVKIYANQNTLRDYIWNVDCAKQVVSDVLNDSRDGVRIVASGRPTSIIMLSNMIQRVTGKPILENYRPDLTNQNDITFSPAILDAKFSASPLEISLKIINQGIKGNGRNISKLIK